MDYGYDYGHLVLEKLVSEMSFAGSPKWCPSFGFEVGQQLLVEVENVFDGGMVVSYQNGKDNLRIRGALLSPPASFNV